MPEASVTSRRPTIAPDALRSGQPEPAPTGRPASRSGRAGWIPLAGMVVLFVLLAAALHLSSRMRSALETHLENRLRVSAELAARALSEFGGGAAVVSRSETHRRLEEIRVATSVSGIWLYDREGKRIGGVSARGSGPAVPKQLRLGDVSAGDRAADPHLRDPENDAAGGLSLLVPLPVAAGGGALLTRLDRDAQGSLPAATLLFQVAKAIAGVAVAAGLLILLRWLTHGAPAGAGSPAPGTSDVDFVLGTVTEVMSTLKDNEAEYRDRWSAAEADAARWRRTSDLILQSMTSGIVAFDPRGRITMFNRAAERILSVPVRRAMGRTVADVLGPEDPVTRTAAELRQRGRPVARLESERTDEDGASRWLEISSSVLRRGDGAGVGGILLIADMTETKRLRDQMELRDRLSAVGEMAAGIAHEIKNSLHSLMGFANLLRDDFAREEPMPVRGILTEVRSLEAMVKGVLEFSRPSSLVKTRASVNAVARDVAGSVEEAARRAGVEVHLETDDRLPEVSLDFDMLRRAFLNLAFNAVEAMDDGGTLTISTRFAERSGEGVRVGFRDTGPGIPVADRARIFTPFYSTKRDGSGLGLALAHKTVADHGGRLQLHSRVGVGTEFVAHLPSGSGS